MKKKFINVGQKNNHDINFSQCYIRWK